MLPQHFQNQPPAVRMIGRIDIPFPIAEEITVFRPELVGGLRQHLVGIIPDGRKSEFFSAVAMIGDADVVRGIVVVVTFARIGGEPFANRREKAERKQGFNLFRRIVVMEYFVYSWNLWAVLCRQETQSYSICNH